MPWTSMSMMDRRCEFVRLARAGSVGVTALVPWLWDQPSDRHPLLRRHQAEELAGLEVRSRRPHRSPRRVSAAMEDQVLAVRTAQMDFKGHFAIGSGRGHALTVINDHCRDALGLRACDDEAERTVHGQLTWLFGRHNLPDAIGADNGAPWGSAGWHEVRCTALGVWLLQPGIALLHGRPRHPQTQGKDERFHRTLDLEVLQHNRFDDLAAYQTAFDMWRTVYNEQRPHEAPGLDVPASRCRASARSLSRATGGAALQRDRPGAQRQRRRPCQLPRPQAEDVACLKACRWRCGSPPRTAFGTSSSRASLWRRSTGATTTPSFNPSAMSPNSCQACLQSEQGSWPYPL